MHLNNTPPHLWLAKCCKIQQLALSYSTTYMYIYVQQHIFIFNILHLYSTIRIFFKLQPKFFSFNKNICSTSTKNNFIQQQYSFSFNPNDFYSKKKNYSASTKIIFIQQQYLFNSSYSVIVWVSVVLKRTVVGD